MPKNKNKMKRRKEGKEEQTEGGREEKGEEKKRIDAKRQHSLSASISVTRLFPQSVLTLARFLECQVTLRKLRKVILRVSMDISGRSYFKSPKEISAGG